jgi:hypothetical protein
MRLSTGGIHLLILSAIGGIFARRHGIHIKKIHFKKIKPLKIHISKSVKAHLMADLMGGGSSMLIGAMVAGPVGMLVGLAIGVATSEASQAWAAHNKKELEKEAEQQQAHDVGVMMWYFTS